MQIFPKATLEEMKVSGFSLDVYISKLAALPASDSPDVHSVTERCKTCSVKKNKLGYDSPLCCTGIKTSEHEQTTSFRALLSPGRWVFFEQTWFTLFLMTVLELVSTVCRRTLSVDFRECKEQRVGLLRCLFHSCPLTCLNLLQTWAEGRGDNLFLNFSGA